MSNATEITNLTFDEINVGDTADYSRLVTHQVEEHFAAVSVVHTLFHL